MTLWDSGGGKWCPRGGDSLIFSMVFYDSQIIHQLGFFGSLPHLKFHEIDSFDTQKWWAEMNIYSSSSKYLGISSYISGQASSRSQRAGWESPKWWWYRKGFFPTKCLDHSLKLTASLPLKIDGWKMEIPFGDGLCSGAMSVSGRVILFIYLDLFLGDFLQIRPRYSSPCFTTIWENMFYFFQAS